MIDIFAWIGAIGSLISNLLVAQKKTIGAYLWCIFTLILLGVAIIQHNKSQIFLFSAYTLLNFYMAYKWYHDDKKSSKNT